MRRNLKVAILPILLIAASAMAQNPCSAADAARALAESRLAAARIRAETFAARLDEALRELERHKGRADETERHLVGEQKTSTSLAASLHGAEAQIEDLKKVIAEKNSEIAAKNRTLEIKDVSIIALAAERDAAVKRAVSANARWNCRLLHLGCIK